MACFIVPATEAVVTTIATKVIEKKEVAHGSETVAMEVEKTSTKLHRLNKLLWGGSALLAFEHLWHGEVTAFFPFLTAASSADSLREMIAEMSTVGVGMAVLVTLVWAVSNVALKHIDKEVLEEEVQ